MDGLQTLHMYLLWPDENVYIHGYVAAWQTSEHKDALLDVEIAGYRVSEDDLSDEVVGSLEPIYSDTRVDVFANEADRIQNCKGCQDKPKQAKKFNIYGSQLSDMLMESARKQMLPVVPGFNEAITRAARETLKGTRAQDIVRRLWEDGQYKP